MLEIFIFYFFSDKMYYGSRSY